MENKGYAMCGSDMSYDAKKFTDSNQYYNYVEKIENLSKQIDLLFEKVASLRESVLKLEQNSQNCIDS